MTKPNHTKFIIVILFFTLFMFSNLSFGQKISPFLINNELFELPGKWEFIGKIENSAQWGFSNKKLKHTLLINVRSIDKFEFYNKDLSELELLNKFYIWESEYWAKDDNNIEVEKIEVNEEEKYIIWRLKIIDKDLENYIIHGMRNSKLIGVSMSDNNKKEPKSRNEKIDFVKNIYFNK